VALFVQKYGGTSVGTLERIEAVADRVQLTRAQGHDVVVVVSAMSGETNRLLGMAQQLDQDANRREMDVLISTGEQVTIALLAIALNKRGCPAVSMTGDQVRIHTDSAYGKARITRIDTEQVQAELGAGKVVVIAGFQGRDEHNAITTLGRGGSDTTAVAVAAAIKADECQIFTDVDGVYTTDPRIEPKARRLDTITFEEMHGSTPGIRHCVQSQRGQPDHSGCAGQADGGRADPESDQRRQHRCRHDSAEHHGGWHRRLHLHGESR